MIDYVHVVNNNILDRSFKRPCGSLSVSISFLKSMTNEELVYKALKLLEVNPELSQRQISSALGVSLGKGHYVLTSLIDVGWVKLKNFRDSKNKLGYAYVLTPAGIVEKAAITVRFLARKQREYYKLQAEIEALRSEVAAIEKVPHFPLGHHD